VATQRRLLTSLPKQFSFFNVSHTHTHTLNASFGSVTAHRLDFAGPPPPRVCRPSHGDRSVRLFGPVAHDVLQLSGVRHVVARLVLRQDLHQRTQLQPPLLLGDPVTADGRAHRSAAVKAFSLSSLRQTSCNSKGHRSSHVAQI